MKRMLVNAVALGAAFSSSAMADGLPSRHKAHAVHHEHEFSWTGFYLGLHAGWEEKRMQGSDFTARGSSYIDAVISDGLSAGSPTNQKIDGWIGGGQLGYNHQFGRFVLGSELSATWGDVQGSSNCFNGGTPVGSTIKEGSHKDTRYTVDKRCDAEQEWSAQWLNKLGVAHGRFMGYVTGGISITEVKINRSASFKKEVQYDDYGFDLRRAASDEWSGKQYYAGVVLGGGVQVALRDNLSLGIEYLHTVYASADTLTHGSDTKTWCHDSCYPKTKALDSNAVMNMQTDTVRVVLNYKFGPRHEEPLK